MIFIVACKRQGKMGIQGTLLSRVHYWCLLSPFSHNFHHFLREMNLAPFNVNTYEWHGSLAFISFPSLTHPSNVKHLELSSSISSLGSGSISISKWSERRRSSTFLKDRKYSHSTMLIQLLNLPSKNIPNWCAKTTSFLFKDGMHKGDYVCKHDFYFSGVSAF